MTSANPFPSDDRDRHEIWDLLVGRDIDAIVSGDWGRVAGDFVPDAFIGLDAQGSTDPSDWQLRFGSLVAYQERWLARSAELQAAADPETTRLALHEATTLHGIDIDGDAAVVQKRLHGRVPGGTQPLQLDWTTLYLCRRLAGRWRIAGFLGYLANDPGAERRFPGSSPKERPYGSSHHATAGPYSPSLVVRPGELVVISGQAALDEAGQVIGRTIEEQTARTLENCRLRLAEAGCSLEDVFKVNAYLADLADWSRFNGVYEPVMPQPRPVRTTIGAALLPGLLVEVEMWAVRP